MAQEKLHGTEAIRAEARKTRETAERMANGDAPPGDADDIRVLAGMIHQVAEQVERLAGVVQSVMPGSEDEQTVPGRTGSDTAA